MTTQEDIKARKIAKEINERNALFKGATRAEKRVLIAKDVLSQLKRKKMRAETGAFVQSEQILAMDCVDEANTGIRELLLEDNGHTCSCCALGGLMVSCTLFNNKETVADYEEDFYNLGHSILEDKKFKNGFDKIFPRKQLELIENAFECGEGFLTEDNANYYDGGLKTSPSARNKAAAFGRNIGTDESDDKKRLEAIMNNIIENNGTFVP